MKPDSFKWQLQAVLITYYLDIEGILGASGCSKPKVVKCKFEDQEDNAGNEDAAADQADVAVTASSPPQASAAAAAPAEGGGGDEGAAAAAASPPWKASGGGGRGRA